MDKPIRVLHVLDKIDINSGVSSVVMNYYRFMNPRKIMFDFMVHEPVHESLKKQILCKGSKIYVMPRLCLSNLFLYQRMLALFFQQHKEYNIVHGHVVNASAFYLKAAEKNGVPIRMIHSHNSKGADTNIKCIRNRILSNIGIHYANQYFACSEKASFYLFGKKKMQRYQVNLLPNAIPTEEYKYDERIREEKRMELGIHPDQLLIGHIGRFCKQKNHTFLIDVFKKVHEIKKNSVLALFGDGELIEEIRIKVKHLHLESAVQFMGSKRNVNEYLQAMDMFVLPSLYEGFPVVCVEAQASGLPCILSDSITKKAKLSQSAKFLNLSVGVDEWARIIIQYEREFNSEQIRKSMERQVIAAGYDIRKECCKLERYYINKLNLLEKRNESNKKCLSSIHSLQIPFI